jgi:hypothetical protein
VIREVCVVHVNVTGNTTGATTGKPGRALKRRSKNCESSKLHKQPGERLELQRCRDQHTICRGAEVPSSTHLPLSPVGINQDAHRLDSRIPLGPRTPSSRTPDMYPHGMPNIPNGRETSPRNPFPPGRAPLYVSSRGGSRPLYRWGPQAAVPALRLAPGYPARQRPRCF